ncbi:phytanoyl-CoA dioxygenase family protein [Aestuariibacter salexigens]|uniref:phytanoyl-CoA dioxygenase family protein n=1 Tax=Aestuariibacter salexigens TaxID=226010 RepID=UPI0004798972|nr:phytanoyl-CoA dioxygenase family protein [Aestuariibacter salexigens]
MNSIPEYSQHCPGPERIAELVKQHGICVMHSHCRNVATMHAEARELLDDFKKSSWLRDYAFGELASVIMEDESVREAYHKRYPALWDYFSQPDFRRIFSFFGLPSERFFKHLYISHDFESQKGMARNGYLHFDRNWTLKFMLYLSDVEEGAGPFNVVPGSHKLGKKLREQGWKSFRGYQNIPNRIGTDIDMRVDDAVPILGKAGTLIVFDTDIFHFGGVVEAGKSRLIARSHSFIPVADVERRWEEIHAAP